MALMEELKAKKGLAQNILARILRIGAAHTLNEFGQSSSVHDITDDPEASLKLILIVDVQNKVGALAHVHQCDFIEHQLSLTLVFEVLNKLKSHYFAVAFASDFENLCKTS